MPAELMVLIGSCVTALTAGAAWLGKQVAGYIWRQQELAEETEAMYRAHLLAESVNAAAERNALRETVEQLSTTVREQTQRISEVVPALHEVAVNFEHFTRTLEIVHSVRGHTAIFGVQGGSDADEERTP